jgi:hypothetical protein
VNRKSFLEQTSRKSAESPGFEGAFKIERISISKHQTKERLGV